MYSDEDLKFKVSTPSSSTTGLKDMPETTAHKSLFIRMNLTLVAHEAYLLASARREKLKMLFKKVMVM